MSNRGRLGWRFVRFAMPATKTQEQRQPLIDGRDLFPRKVAEYATNPALVDGSEMVDQREGLSGKAAPAWRQGRIKESLARSPGHRDHAHERETLVAYDIRIADYDAGPCTALFAADCGIEIHHDKRAAADLHARPATQPSPGTHRTGLPALLSTSASVSSSGKPRVHSSSPCPARSALSGWGFCRDRRSSARRRRSNSWRTASVTNLLRLFSRRSMSRTRSLGRVTVTRSTLDISYSQYDHTSDCGPPQLPGGSPFTRSRSPNARPPTNVATPPVLHAAAASAS